jgi:hypothetical protein
MSMVVSKHESKIRVGLQYAILVFALVLVGQLSLADVSLKTFSLQAVQNIAGVVGMTVGVAPNEANTLAQELRARELNLESREQALDAREQDVRALIVEETAKNDRSTMMLIIGVALFLAALIGANFYLDYKRRGVKEEQEGNETSTAVDPHAHTGEFTTKL